jgi:sugar lactone lactonase YvrE
VAPPTYSGGRIDRVDLSTGEVTTLYRACGDRPLRGPNDLVFDETGGFWFTDHGIRTAFITCSGTGHLIAVDWPRAGRRLAFPRTVPT